MLPIYSMGTCSQGQDHMAHKVYSHWLIEKTHENDNIPRWFDAFLIDRKAQGLAAGTIEFYGWKLRLIDRFFYTQGISNVNEITPDIIRAMMINLESSHTPGGVHQVYRVIRTFLRWYAIEAEPDNWHDPLANIKPPRLSEIPLSPVTTNDVKKLIAACPDTFTGNRDKAIFLFLLDTGVRASELCALNREDVDEIEGSVQVKNGKGGKSRIVVMGKKTRKAMRAYLRSRSDDDDPLWLTDDGDRLSYAGLNHMLERRAKQARIPKPGLHDFRRAFALNCLRNGMDIFSLQRLMGHADLQVMRRYLAQTDDDLREAHARSSPVDNAM